MSHRFVWTLALAFILGLTSTAQAQTTPNQIAIDFALATVNGCAGVGNYPASCGDVIGAGDDELQQANAEEVGANTRMATEASNGAAVAIAIRSAELRAGVTGFSMNSNGLAAWNLAPQLGRGAGDSDSSIGQSGRLGGFLNLKYSTGDDDADAYENELDFDSAGIVLGVDYRLNESAVVGVALGYTNYDVDFENDARASTSGELETDAYSVSLYGTWYQGPYYIDGTATLGWSDHDLDRDLFSGALTLGPFTASSDTDGLTYGGSVSLGYNHSQDALTLTPYFKTSYLDVNIDSFTEGGTAVAGGLNLRVGDQDFESLVGELGVEGSYAISTDFGVILPQFRGAYKHEFMNGRENINALFPQSTGAIAQFNIRTREGDEDYFTVGTGASMVLRGGIQAFLVYDTVLGLDDVNNHVITLGVRGEF